MEAVSTARGIPRSTININQRPAEPLLVIIDGQHVATIHNRGKGKAKLGFERTNATVRFLRESEWERVKRARELSSQS